MIERDYIMRMINMLSQALARILFRRNLKQYGEAIHEIDHAGRELLGVDLQTLEHLSASDLQSLFGLNPTAAAHRFYVAAALLKELGDIHTLKGESESALAISLNSLSLSLEAYRRAAGPVGPDHVASIDQLLRMLKPSELPSEILEKLFWYFEESGRFDRAEDVLNDLLARQPVYRDRGMEFYRRLLEKTDEALDNGKLPRSEVEEGLSLLQTQGTKP